MDPSESDVPEGTYIELVRGLFEAVLPPTIMSLSFVGIGALINYQTPDPWLVAIVALGTIASLVRLGVLLACRRQARGGAMDVERAWRLERRYAGAYLAFAAVLGAFGVRALQIAAPQSHMLVIGMLVGYCAGVASGLSLRPRISLPSMLLATCPTIMLCAATPDLTFRALALLLTALLGGAIGTLIARYRGEVSKITMRRTYAGLARKDHLTGLPNRLSLAERYRAVAGRNPNDRDYAVHCLDLDRFKPVNDRYGHPAGDALLCAIAERLQGLLRQEDFVARLGGDEFIVIQSGVRTPEDAEMLAWRIVHNIGRPYKIDGLDIRVTASVGYAISQQWGLELERLAARADEALYRVKRDGGGAAMLARVDAARDGRRVA